MRAFTTIVFAITASLLSSAIAAPLGRGTLQRREGAIIVHPGTVDDIIFTDDNTINGTHSGNTTVHNPKFKVSAAATGGTEKLKLALKNNFNGDQVNAYVSGQDSAGKVVLLKPDGSWYYPDSAGSAVPVAIDGNLVKIPLGAKGSVTNIQLPGFISSGRVWFAEGDLHFFAVATATGAGLVEPAFTNPSDPSAGVNWGFVELTNNAGGLYANISYVDFIGFVLSMSMVAGDGSVQLVKGLQPGAVVAICADLTAQAAIDGAPWDSLCMKDTSGKVMRVLAPIHLLDLKPGSFDTYFTQYINDVWSAYSSKDLTINTQGTPGNVACRVSGDTLNCAGDNRGYAKPVARDIFGCDSGTMYIQRDTDNAVHYAVAPRLCAAFTRSTLLLPSGDVQPSLDATQYYTTSPTNRYSQFVHRYELDNKGYSFAYDDVNPNGENAAGVVADANPQLLTIYVGGYPN